MELNKVIEKRRSVRDFDPLKQIDKKDIEKIVNAGIEAPVGKGKYNDVHLTVVQNKDIIDEIVEATKEQNKSYTKNVFYNAPTIIIVSHKKLDEFKELAYQNTGCIMENMLLAATDLGIDSLYVFSAIRSIVKSLKILRIINLPDGFTPTAVAVLGYNKADSHKKFNRNIAVNWL